MPRLIAILGAVVLMSSTVPASDWARFRGPSGQNYSPSRTAPAKWGPAENITWKTPLPGPGSSSPIVVGNRVFLTCYSGYGLEPDQGASASLKRHALCLDRATGRILWQFAAPSPGGETVYTGRYITAHGYASATPVSDGRNVYFFLANSGVFAFTLDGKRLWHADVGSKSHDWGSGASPMLHGDLLIVNASAESDQIVALSRSTGKQVWAQKGFARAWNTPVILDVNGRSEMLVATQMHIRALDPRTGNELWRTVGIRAAELCPSIVWHKDVAYLIGSPKGEAMAVRAGGNGDVTASHVLWRQTKGSNVSSPIYHEGHLYFASDSRGILYCLNAATGEVVYEQRLPGRVGQIYASPVLVGDKLYYFSRTGGGFVVAAKPKFELLAQNPPLDNANGSATPAIVDGQIFIRTDAAAYCIGKRVN